MKFLAIWDTISFRKVVLPSDTRILRKMEAHTSNGEGNAECKCWQFVTRSMVDSAAGKFYASRGWLFTPRAKVIHS